MHVTSPLRRTLVASTTVSFAATAVALLYLNPWGVPRIVAGILVGSLLVAIAVGKLLKYRLASADRPALQGPQPRSGGIRPDRQARPVKLFSESAGHQ